MASVTFLRNGNLINTIIWGISSFSMASMCYQYYSYNKPLLEVSETSHYVFVKNHGRRPFKITEISLESNDNEMGTGTEMGTGMGMEIGLSGSKIVSSNSTTTYKKSIPDKESQTTTSCKICSTRLFGLVLCNLYSIDKKD